METYLEISESGRAKDAQGVALLEGTPAEVRRWTTHLIVLDRLDGHPKAAAFLDGTRFKPTAGEIAAVEVAIDAVLHGTEDVDDDDDTDEDDFVETRVVKSSPSLRDRLRL